MCHIVIDVDDLDRGVAFWSAALDATEEPLGPQSSGIYRKLRLPDSDIRVPLQATRDPKTSKERVHIDIETDDVAAEVRRLEALGATRWDHQRERASTSGSCGTRGATSSACCSRSTPSCSPAAVPGQIPPPGRDRAAPGRPAGRHPTGAPDSRRRAASRAALTWA